MPIVPIFARAAFNPAMTRLMGDAFDQAMGSLSVVPAKIIQEAMAKRILEAASQGEHSVDELRAVALTGMGVTH